VFKPFTVVMRFDTKEEFNFQKHIDLPQDGSIYFERPNSKCRRNRPHDYDGSACQWQLP
jgi:hypothetical protein